MARNSFYLLLGVLILSFAGCGDKIDPITVNPPPPDGGNSDAVISYDMDIKPILDSHCILCHASDKQGLERNGAPVQVNLDSYENVTPFAQNANARIQSGTMPPTGGIPLEERTLFQGWIDQSLPRTEE